MLTTFFAAEGTRNISSARYQEELDHAAQSWVFDVKEHTNRPNPDSSRAHTLRIIRRILVE
jgi:hypothetical protein